MKIVITGMIVTYPVGGVWWDYGQYALGLEKMGHEVYYLEDTGWQTYDPVQGVYGEDCTYGVNYLRNALAQFSPKMAKRWSFLSMNGTSYGLSQDSIEKIVSEADLFVNVSGSCLLRDAYMRCPRKVLIDSDPGWNQFVNYPKWDNNPGWQGAHSYRDHDFFFTYAENIHKSDCLIPSMGLSWQTTRPLVVMDYWRPSPPAEKWTTVMTWKNFREPIECEGKSCGTKEVEFPRIEQIPSRAKGSFEVAVGGNDAPRRRWRELGWSVIDSHGVSKTSGDYRHYIQSSRGEFSVAKNVYVDTRSGWFSCRSICYMAAGRPVVLQDTGFSKHIPTGEGVMAFSTLEEAVDCLEQVESDYDRHSKAARQIARTYFSSDVVLNDILNRVGL